MIDPTGNGLPSLPPTLANPLGLELEREKIEREAIELGVRVDCARGRQFRNASYEGARPPGVLDK
jgi:hypothetical protein